MGYRYHKSRHGYFIGLRGYAMTLLDYIKTTPEGDEITVWDKDYDMEVYFYNQEYDAWEQSMMDLASKLDVINTTNGGVVVNLSELIERNIDALSASDLFYDTDIDSIMDDMESILAGNVSEDWLNKFVDCLA